MFIPKSPYTKIAFETLFQYFKKASKKNIEQSDIPSEFYQTKRACFVSLHMSNGDLRGCIGTLEPQEENIVVEIQRNALSAALHDHRFSALNEHELDDIDISVDVLSLPEKIFSINDLDPQNYGLILSDDIGRRGVLLPNLEGIDTVKKQIDIVKRKAGLENTPIEILNMSRFTSTRYY